MKGFIEIFDEGGGSVSLFGSCYNIEIKGENIPYDIKEKEKTKIAESLIYSTLISYEVPMEDIEVYINAIGNGIINLIASRNERRVGEFSLDVIDHTKQQEEQKFFVECSKCGRELVYRWIDGKLQVFPCSNCTQKTYNWTKNTTKEFLEKLNEV